MREKYCLFEECIIHVIECTLSPSPPLPPPPPPPPPLPPLSSSPLPLPSSHVLCVRWWWFTTQSQPLSLTSALSSSSETVTLRPEPTGQSAVSQSVSVSPQECGKSNWWGLSSVLACSQSMNASMGAWRYAPSGRACFRQILEAMQGSSQIE